MGELSKFRLTCAKKRAHIPRARFSAGARAPLTFRKRPHPEILLKPRPLLRPGRKGSARANFSYLGGLRQSGIVRRGSIGGAERRPEDITARFLETPAGPSLIPGDPQAPPAVDRARFGGNLPNLIVAWREVWASAAGWLSAEIGDLMSHPQVAPKSPQTPLSRKVPIWGAGLSNCGEFAPNTGDSALVEGRDASLGFPCLP